MGTWYDQYSRNLTLIMQMRARQAAQVQQSAAPTYSPMAMAQGVMKAQKQFQGVQSIPRAAATKKVENRGRGGFAGFLEKALPAVSPGLYLAKEAADTSPGRAVLDILSRGTYASANTMYEDEERRRSGEGPDPDKYGGFTPSNMEAQLESFWEGLSGKNKRTYADVERLKNPDQGDVKTSLKGLVQDIAFDPTTYISGAGLVSGISRLGARGTKILKPTEQIVEKAAETGVVPTPRANVVEKILADGQKATATAAKPTLKITPVEVIQDSQRNGIMDMLSSTPRRAYADDLDVPSPFRSEDEIVMEKVAREIEEEVPIEELAQSGKKTAPKADSRLAQLRSIKASILQDPDYTVGNHKVGDLLRAAGSANEDQVKMINKLVDDEAKRVYKEADYERLPQVTKLYTREGKPAPFGLTQEQLTDLMHRGEIGGTVKAYGKETDEFTHQFPIHDPDDLNNVYLKTIEGQLSLKDYLGKLGIEVKAVNKNDFDELFKPVDDFVLPGQSGKATKKVKKTVYDEVPKTVSRTRGLTKAESVLWVAQQKGRLAPEDIAYLTKAKNPADFDKRLGVIKARVITDGFTSVDEFVAAAKSGLIPDEAVAKMLNIAGAKNIDDLASKAKSLATPKVKAAERFKAGEVPEDDFATPGVVRAEELMARAEAGDTTAIAKPEISGLTDTQVADLAKALPWAVVENLVDPSDIAKYPFLTNIKKAKRTSKTAGQGRARNLHGWHGISQSDVFRSLVKSASSRHPIPAGLKGRELTNAWRARSVAMYDEIMPVLQVSEEALRREGVSIITGTDNAGLPLSLYDVLSAMDRKLVEQHLFNPRTSVMPTEILQAADGIIRAKLGQVPMNVAAMSAHNIFKSSPKLRQLSRTRKGSPHTQGDEIGLRLMQELVDQAHVIAQRVENNYARAGAELGTAIKSMTDEVIANIVKKYADPNVPIGEAFGDLVMRGDDASKIGRKIDAPTEAYDASRNMMDAKLGQALTPGDLAEAKSAKAMAGVKTEKEATKVGVKQNASRNAEAEEVLAETIDLGDRYATQFSQNLFRANVPLLDKVYTMKDTLGRAFVAHYGHADLHELLRTERSVTQDFARMHRGLIAQLSDSLREQFGADAGRAAQEAFKYLQADTLPVDPNMLAAVNGLKSSIDLTFGSSVDNIGSFAQRNGIFARHLNEILDYYHAPKGYRFDEKKPFIEQQNEWRNWAEVEDPLSLLDIMHAAMQRATVDVTLGRAFSNDFGSVAAQPGFVKVTDKGGKSSVGNFIDKDLYYPKEIVEQLKYLDDVMKGSISGIKNPTADSVIKMYDGIIHAWKSGLTIYRPGHHVRNLIGDVSLAFFDGVTNPAVYYKSIRILSGRSKAYQEWDGLKALQEGTPLAGPQGPAKTTVRVGRKKVSLTDDEVWRAAFNQGIIPDYRTLDDIAFNTQQSLQFKTGKGISLTRPTGGRAQKVAGGVSQARDHMVRIAHFLDVIQKGNFRTLEEAFDQAGRRVRKWHPDGTDLSNFENKVMRRSFMFYSWMRKAIPLVVETLVMKPGKAVLFPKAMYAYAEANGVDLDALSNPFPVDQLFPEFLTDQILGPHFGESGDYGGINPGEPVSEMVSQWGQTDPQRTLMGSATPVARVPLELLTGTSFGTGAAITDKSDYADSQIPGVNYASKISGHSFTGAGEPTRDVERGNVEGGVNNEALINFLTGLGIRDYSKPNYIKRAELEKRDKAREAARNG